MQNTSLKERAIKSVFWVGSARLLGQLFSWSVTILLVRILAPEDFGLMGMMMAYQAIIIIIYDLSLGEAIIQKKDLSEKDTTTCFWFTICFGLILTLFTWFISPTVAIFFKKNQIIWMLRISSLGIFCLSVKEIHTILLCRNLDFDKRSKAQLFSGIISLIVSLVMALFGFGIWSLVFGLLANHFSHTLFTLYYIRWKPKLYFSFDRLMNMFRFAAPMAGTNILRYFSNSSDSIIVGRYLGADPLGYYRVAMDLSRIPIEKFISIINQVCFPVFSKLQNDIENLRSYFIKVVQYIALSTLPMFIGMILVSTEIIELILTPKWLPSLQLFRIFCILAILQSLGGVFTSMLKARGKVIVIFRFSLMNGIFLPVSFLLAVPFGLEAIAYCWLIIFPPLFLYLFLHVIRELELTLLAFLKIVLPACVGSGVMATSVLTVRVLIHPEISSWGLLSVCIIIGATSFLTYLFVFYKAILKDAFGLARTAFLRG